jgi:hypothetical protein
MDDTTGRGGAGVWTEYTEEKPKPIGRLLSLPGVFLMFAGLFTSSQGGNMWWIFGFAIAVVIAAAYVLTRRPNRRTTIVVERD